jgi:O-antigen/teichoic acid export membrane protein
VGVPVGSLGPVIVKFAANYFAKDETEKAARLYSQMFKFIFVISVLLFLTFIALTPQIKNFLRIQETSYVIFSGLIISFFYLNLVNSSFIQSLLKFNYLAFLSVFGSFAKIIFGILLIFLGFKIFGALGGIFAMTFSTFIISFLPLRSVFKNIKNNKTKIPVKEIISYALPTSFAIFFLTSFTSTDVILVKHFFNPHDAGFYAGLSLIGKVIFYFTGPIPMVMFPLLIKRHSLGKNFNSLFYLALLLVIFPSILITVFYFLFPSFVINIFLGGKEYLKISPYLGFFGVYLTVFSLVNVYVNFFLSLNKMKIVPMVVIASILQALLIALFHSSFYQVIGVSLGVSLVLFALLIFYYFSQYTRFKKTSTPAFIDSSPAI